MAIVAPSGASTHLTAPRCSPREVRSGASCTCTCHMRASAHHSRGLLLRLPGTNEPRPSSPQSSARSSAAEAAEAAEAAAVSRVVTTWTRARTSGSCCSTSAGHLACCWQPWRGHRRSSNKSRPMSRYRPRVALASAVRPPCARLACLVREHCPHRQLARVARRRAPVLSWAARRVGPLHPRRRQSRQPRRSHLVGGGAPSACSADGGGGEARGRSAACSRDRMLLVAAAHRACPSGELRAAYRQALPQGSPNSIISSTAAAAAAACGRTAAAAAALPQAGMNMGMIINHDAAALWGLVGLRSTSRGVQGTWAVCVGVWTAVAPTAVAHSYIVIERSGATVAV